MTAALASDSGFFAGRLDRLINNENSPSLRRIRTAAFSDFSGLPFVPEGEVKFTGALKEMAVSRFSESFKPFIGGYSPGNKLCGIGELADFTGSVDAGLIRPLTGFGGYCLAFFEKGMFIECGNSAEKGFVQIDSGLGLSPEPVYIRVPAGVSATLFLSLNGAGSSLALNLIRIEAGEASSIKLFIHSGGAGCSRFVDLSARLEKDSRAELFVMRVEGGDFVYRSNLSIKGENARFTENSLASLKGRERADIRSVVVEEARGTEAGVEVRAIVAESSRAGLNGLIKVGKEAVKSRSRYAAHCLKLSPASRADIRPDLEIEALDIEASHAASVSPLDEERLFYLEARGMSPEQAGREISLGFLASLLRENDEIAPLVEKHI